MHDKSTWPITARLLGTKTKFTLHLLFYILLFTQTDLRVTNPVNTTATIIDFVSISFTRNELVVPNKTNKRVLCRVRIIYLDRCTEYKYLLFISNHRYCVIKEFFLFLYISWVQGFVIMSWHKIGTYPHLHNDIKYNILLYINIYNNNSIWCKAYFKRVFKILKTQVIKNNYDQITVIINKQIFFL